MRRKTAVDYYLNVVLLYPFVLMTGLCPAILLEIRPLLNPFLNHMNDQQHVIEALRKLAESDEHKTKAWRFRKKLPEIEDALAKGYYQRAVIEALANEGIHLTPATFKTYLQRARRSARIELESKLQ